MHGGISDHMHLKTLNTLTRHRCKMMTECNHNEIHSMIFIDVSIEVKPKSKDGGNELTQEEEDEYRQVQGTSLIPFQT